MPYYSGQGMYPQYGIGDIIAQAGQLAGSVYQAVEGPTPTSPNISYPYGYPYRTLGTPAQYAAYGSPAFFDTSNYGGQSSNTWLAIGVIAIIAVLAFRR